MSPERISSQPYSFPADIWWVPRLGLPSLGLALAAGLALALAAGLALALTLALVQPGLTQAPAAHRSLGLALLECSTGKYPYPAAAGPVQLMMHVSAAPAPLGGPCAPPPPAASRRPTWRTSCALAPRLPARLLTHPPPRLCPLPCPADLRGGGAAARPGRGQRGAARLHAPVHAQGPGAAAQRRAAAAAPLHHAGGRPARWGTLHAARGTARRPAAGAGQAGGAGCC
jgi:hypothetical protein